jgi:hypothetical protein
MTLDEFCMLVAQHRPNSNSLSAVKPVIIIYLRTLAGIRLRDGGVFSSNIKEIGLQFR